MTTETTTAPTTDAEMLRRLRNPEFAIGFALEHLQPWELAMFFTDWQADADMTGWPSAGFVDTEIRCLTELESWNAEKEVQPRVQA